MTMMRRAIVLCRNAVTYADLRMYLNFIVTSAAQIFLLFLDVFYTEQRPI